MIEERPYPHEIIEQWEAAIITLPLSSDEIKCIMDIVHYVQPPLSLTTLAQAATLYINDVRPFEIDAAILNLQSSNIIPHNAPEHIGTNYPVYYALTHTKHLAQSSSAFAKKSRQYFSHLFSEVDLSKRISRGNFYTHILAARDVICAVIESGYDITDDQEPLDKAIVRAIKSDAFFTQRNRLNDKIDILRLLSEEVLQPGEKQRDYYSISERNSCKNTVKNDPWHNKRLSILANSPQPKRIIFQKENCLQSYAETAGQSQKTKFGIQEIPAKSPKKNTTDNEDASESITVIRTAPNMLTRADDKQIVRRFTRGAPTSELPAITDLARLTSDTIHEVLEQPLSVLLKNYAILLLCLGLPPKRLMRLTISQHVSSVIVDEKDERPHWCTAENVLYYRLLDGPAVRNANPASRWVQLTLPPEMTEYFNSFQLSERPFRSARSQLNRQLKRYFRSKPGIVPTANRLRASSWLYRRPNAIDDVVSATLSGQFGLDLAAPAAYRQLPRDEVQQLFDKTLAQLGIIRAFLPINTHVGTNRITTTAGSTVAKPPDFFQTIFRKLREAIREPQSQVEQWWLGKPFPIEHLISLSRLVAAHELLGWQLSSGARPVGPSSANRISKKHQWVHDKNSARGIESRVIPILANVRDSLDSLQRWHSSLISVAESADVLIDDQRTGRLHTPAVLVRSHRNQHLVLRDMRWSDLSTISLPLLSEGPNNVARHSLASWLRRCVADAQVDALLGHARHGRTLSSPRAEASLGLKEQSQLRHSLQQWLQACGYQPLNWSCMPWHY